MKNGVLYKDHMTRIMGTMNLKGTYRMPSTVKDLWDGAFAGNDKLKKVILSDHIQILFSGDFANCKSLREIKLGKRMRRIYEFALYGTKIRTLTLPPKKNIVNLTGNSIKEIRTSNKKLRFEDEDEEDFISATSKKGKRYAKRHGLKKLTFI